MSKEPSTSKKYKITTNLVDLISQEALISMAYFTDSYCKVFWSPNFSMLRQADSITNCSECLSQHIAIQIYA